MDCMIQLQQRKQRRLATTIAEEDEEDVADFYKYIPRRKGDFPPVSYEPADDIPSATRYEILDRVFDNDIPVYILRPHTTTNEQEIAETQRSPSLPSSQRSHNGEGEKTDVPGSFTGIRSTSSRQTPASARSTPLSTLAYDPNDPSLVRVELFEIESYVTPRQLERYETYRFENPRPEDFPIMVPRSRASSEIQRFKREKRPLERQDVRGAKLRGRRPMKKARIGPMVVIENPHARSIAGNNSMLLKRVSGMTLNNSSMDNDSMDLDVAPSIEIAPGKIDMIDMEDTPRGTGGTIAQLIQDQHPAKLRSNQSTRSTSRHGSSSSAERQLSRENLAQQSILKRRGRTPNDLVQEMHVSSLRPPPNAPTKRCSKLSQNNGYQNSSASTARSNSKPTTQSTIDTYLKAMSKIREARKLSSTA